MCVCVRGADICRVKKFQTGNAKTHESTHIYLIIYSMRRNISSGNLQNMTQSKSALRLSQLEGGASSPLLENAGIETHRDHQKTIKLKHGVCSYCIYGPALENSRGLVVCIHGLTLASYVFTDIAASLAKKRFTVLTFDLFARGSSVLNDSRNILDDDFYVIQLRDLLQGLELFNSRITLLGASLGGGVAVSFCAQFPEKVERMILVAPVGLMPQNALPWVTRLHSSFGCLGRIAQFFLEKCCAGCVEQYLLDSFKYSRWAEFFQDDVAKPYFIQNYWNTLRNFPFSDMLNVYRRVRDTSDCKILLIWGEDDRIVPFETSKAVIDVLRRAKLVSWKDVGHEITVGNGGKLVSSWMNQALLNFLSGR